MAELVWTDEARMWLREIRDHIAKDNPPAADRTVAGIYDKAQLLKTFPEIVSIPFLVETMCEF
jgi:toxin ParE1/3/4